MRDVVFYSREHLGNERLNVFVLFCVPARRMKATKLQAGANGHYAINKVAACNKVCE